MASFAASLLDELMGRNRNADPKAKGRDIEWSDSEVCKFNLCGFCPHELFTNTRADLGNCDKIHDDELTKNYNRSSRYLRMGYEEEFLTFLQNLIAEVDRRIRRGHQRLALNAAHNSAGGAGGVQDDKIQLLSERINDLVEQAETLGCEGRVEEAQGVLKLCDQLKEERIALQEAKSNPNQLTPKEMEVCPVCGAFLVVGDAQQRVEEHLSGKQHMGYAKVRTTIETLKKKLRGEDPEREARLAQERAEREKEKEREREREREREKEREKRREEEEAERRRKERGRDEHHNRSSSRSRRRSRSRSRHSTKKSRSRSRDRHHKSKEPRKSHRRSRSRSSGRRHSSRDKKSRDRTSSSRDKQRDHRSQDNSSRNGDSVADKPERTDIDGAKSGDSI